MRIWSLHPKYLDSKGLVALWREALLAKHVLEGKTKGYKNHPQLNRFKAMENPIEVINQYLSEIYIEATHRNYNFDKQKINWNFKKSQMNVTVGHLTYEASHLLNKLHARDKIKYEELKTNLAFETHPLFKLVDGEVENWEIVIMATKTKIKIIDNTSLRAGIDELYEQTNQINLAKWAIKCAKHVLPLTEFENIDTTSIDDGFKINELWQTGNASVHEVRQAGFKIHEVARQCKSEITKSAIRTVGQAVAVGHMREHAMVCSDYAMKTIQLAFPDQIDKITQERQWQLDELRQYK